MLFRSRGRIVLVGVMLPGVDQHSRLVGERRALAAHAERAVRTASLDEDVAVVMRMADQGRVHVEQCDTTETALEDLDGRGQGELLLID